MLSETDRERIRRAFHLEKKSTRQIAKEEGCSRDTIRGAISNDPLKPYWLTRKRPAPVFGPYQLRLTGRLTHKGHIIEFVGESYRFRHRLQQERQPAEEGRPEVG